MLHCPSFPASRSRGALRELYSSAIDAYATTPLRLHHRVPMYDMLERIGFLSMETQEKGQDLSTDISQIPFARLRRRAIRTP